MINQNKCIASVILVVLVSSFFLGCGGGDENEDAKQAEVDLAQQAQLNQQEEATSKKALEEAVALLWNKSSEDERHEWKQYLGHLQPFDPAKVIVNLNITNSWDELGALRQERITSHYEEYLSVIEEAAAKVEAEAPSALHWNNSDREGRNEWKELCRTQLGGFNFNTNVEWDDLRGDVRRELMKTHEDYLILKTAKEEASKRETAFQDRVQSAERLFPDNHKTVVDMARYVNFIEEFEDSPAHFLINLLLEMRAYKEYYAQNPPEDRGAIWYTFYYKVSGRQRDAQLNRSMFNYFLKFIEERVENSSYKNALDATAQLHDLCSKKSEVGDIELAIENGALVNVRQIDSTPLMLALKNENDSEVLLKLLEFGSSLNICDGEGNTPLMLAIDHGYDKDFISKLLSMGAIAKSRNNNDEFPIVMAVRANDKEIVSLLLQSYKCSNPNCGFYSDVFFDIEKPDWAQDLMCPDCDEPARKNQIMFGDGSIERVNLDSKSGQQKDIGINSTVGDLDGYGRRYKWSKEEEHSWGKTPLIEAVFYDEVDVGMISHLVKAGAGINHLWNITNSKPELSSIGVAKAYTPFQLAIEIPRTKSLEKIIALIDSGADVLSPMIQQKAEGGWFEYATPLMIACQRQTKDVVSTLLEKYNAQGALTDHINITDAKERTALCYAAEYSESPEIISELIKYGAEIISYSVFQDRMPDVWKAESFKPVAEHLTPLMLAAKSNTPELVRVLIESGSDVHATTLRGKTALMFAAQYNGDDLVCSELIKSGAKINGIDYADGLSPLIYASIYNNIPNVISALVEAGASITQRAGQISNFESNNKFRMHGNWEATRCRCLYRSDADDDYAMGDPGREHSHYSLFAEQRQTDFDYSRNGFTISRHSVQGMTPLMFAARWNQNPAIIERLLEHGAKVNEVDGPLGLSPIQHAAQMNLEPQVMQALIDAGADVNAVNNRYATAILLAGSFNTDSVCSVLIDAGADITVTLPVGRGATQLGRPVQWNGDFLTLFQLMTRNEFTRGSELWNTIKTLTLKEQSG